MQGDLVTRYGSEDENDEVDNFISIINMKNVYIILQECKNMYNIKCGS